MTPTIRRADRADLPTLIELHRSFCAIDRHPFSEPRVRRAFDGLVDDDTHGVVWIIDDPLAYAALTWGWSIEAGGSEAVLDEIFVSERGRGVGSALIEHLVTDARRRGVARIFLETESHNERVRGLYARHGFLEDDSIWMSLEFTELS